MRIGISALFYASGGSLTNLVQLLRVWAADGTLGRHELVLFASDGTVAGLRRECGDELLGRLRISVLSRTGGGWAGRLIAEQFSLLRRLREERIDVLFCPGNVIPYAARVPTVAVFQNAAPFCDSVTRRSVGFAKWIPIRLLGFLVRLTARKATRVIFISRFFRDLFVERYAFPAEKGVVILRAGGGGGERAADAELPPGVVAPYILSLSNVNPYKNLIELIEGFALAVGDRPHRLVIVGLVNYPAYFQAMKDTVARCGLEGRVIFTGELPHRAVEALLSGCESFVFTSTCENCPTALIEAMSFGLPVASSAVGVMPEIGGDAVRYLDPDSPQSIAEALAALMTDGALRADLAARARARAATFPGAS
ncbi:MAG TPA: glycosyltransferase family 1 protein, partial [Thermoanaerobaculia bacterium]|nr:glycosyltransferase family 1 protein [Thermoanaerobaculia bacterium]